MNGDDDKLKRNKLKGNIYLSGLVGMVQLMYLFNSLTQFCVFV
jgi:hypothetical protein